MGCKLFVELYGSETKNRLLNPWPIKASFYPFFSPFCYSWSSRFISIYRDPLLAFNVASPSQSHSVDEMDGQVCHQGMNMNQRHGETRLYGWMCLF